MVKSALASLTDRYWEVIERLKITQFFTTPSAFKLLMKAGDDHVQKHDISSLQVIGSGMYV